MLNCIIHNFHKSLKIHKSATKKGKGVTLNLCSKLIESSNKSVLVKQFSA